MSRKEFFPPFKKPRPSRKKVLPPVLNEKAYKKFMAQRHERVRVEHKHG